MTEATNTNTRGGSRAGAGRPKLDQPPVRINKIRLTDGEWAALKSMGTTPVGRGQTLIQFGHILSCDELRERRGLIESEADLAAFANLIKEQVALLDQHIVLRQQILALAEVPKGEAE